MALDYTIAALRKMNQAESDTCRDCGEMEVACVCEFLPVDLDLDEEEYGTGGGEYPHSAADWQDDQPEPISDADHDYQQKSPFWGY